MNKYNNPRLLNTVVSGTGMKHPVRPHVILGDDRNGYLSGDLIDANGVLEVVKDESDKINDQLNQLKEDILNEILDSIVGTDSDVIGDAIRDLVE